MENGASNLANLKKGLTTIMSTFLIGFANAIILAATGTTDFSTLGMASIFLIVVYYGSYFYGIHLMKSYKEYDFLYAYIFAIISSLLGIVGIILPTITSFANLNPIFGEIGKYIYSAGLICLAASLCITTISINKIFTDLGTISIANQKRGVIVITAFIGLYALANIVITMLPRFTEVSETANIVLLWTSFGFAAVGYLYGMFYYSKGGRQFIEPNRKY